MLQAVPDLHDGWLDSISLLSDDGLELGCRTYQGVSLKLRISGVKALRADNFLAGNIILEIDVFRGPDIEEEPLRILLDERANSPSLIATLAKAHSENWTYLELNSSYGCELSVVFTGSLEVVR